MLQYLDSITPWYRRFARCTTSDLFYLPYEQLCCQVVVSEILYSLEYNTIFIYDGMGYRPSQHHSYRPLALRADDLFGVCVLCEDGREYTIKGLRIGRMRAHVLSLYF